MTRFFGHGQIRLDRIVERVEPFLDARRMFPDLEADELDRQRLWLERIGAIVSGSDILTLTIQSFVVRTPHHTILVDACVGNGKSNSIVPQWSQLASTAYMDNLASAGLSVDDIDIVFCTHLHPDHVGWNTRLMDGRWVPTFPNAQYLFGKAEYENWEADHRETPNPTFSESVLPVVEAGQVRLVGPDASIDDHVRLIPAPGHTPGHQSVIVGQDEAMITGDIVHSPIQISRPDLSPFFDQDRIGAVDTRTRALELMSEKKMLCCAVHFPAPSIFGIRRHGSTFRCDEAE